MQNCELDLVAFSKINYWTFISLDQLLQQVINHKNVENYTFTEHILIT